ncbi:TBC1 domain family member 1 [Gossypium arboreum]|uniref:TBC1 domain family member 1 n=1 Tax=Gossypium arboreum TaxID=29729 RepID=A0A0B0NEU3_GOSAR|nr:TBC1 domain family member 1 [Gossypium arboreum]
MRLVSSLVLDKSELHITLSNFRLGGKMALQIAYSCPHGQGHGMAHRLDTLACGWSCDLSQYPLQFSHGLAHGHVLGRVTQLRVRDATNPISRGRPPRYSRNVGGSCSTARDSIAKSEAQAPARTYAIHAREDASAPDVITDTFSLLDTDIISLIDPGSTHSYIRTKFASDKNMIIEFIEFVVKVSSPLG